MVDTWCISTALMETLTALLDIYVDELRKTELHLKVFEGKNKFSMKNGSDGEVLGTNKGSNDISKFLTDFPVTQLTFLDLMNHSYVCTVWHYMVFVGFGYALCLT
jgi:hypothetical protein